MSFNHGHALVIGVGSYKYEPKLSALLPARDAQQVADVLRNPWVAGYPHNQVEVLCDSEATRDIILQKLVDLAKNIKEIDTFLIFYCGHGMYGSDQKYYLTTHDTQTIYDTQLKKRRVIAGSGIVDSELLQKIRDIKAQRVFLILNACYSGAVAPSLGDNETNDIDTLESQSLPDQTALALLGTGEGRVLVTACRASQKSYFDPKAQITPFSQALIDGLHGKGVSNLRGYISIFDLYQHIFSTVSEEAKSRWSKEQEPELTINKGIGAMAVALYQGASAVGTLSPQDRPSVLKGAVREINPEESRVAFQQVVQSVTFGRDSHIGDTYDLRYASSPIIKPEGSVTQYFGSSHFVDTRGGDYAEGNIDKRQGAFIEGGTFQAPIVGFNKSDSIVMGNEKLADTVTYSLQEIYEQVRRAVGRAQEQNEISLIIDLQHSELDLKAALDAEQKGKEEQRHHRLALALETLRTLSQQHIEFHSLVHQLQQLQR